MNNKKYHSMGKVECPTCASKRVERLHRGYLKKHILKAKPNFFCLKCDSTFNRDLKTYSKATAQGDTSIQDMGPACSLDIKTKILFATVATVVLFQWVALWKIL